MALVGLTGSGKTTLTALATRLYDVTGGASASTGSTSGTSPAPSCVAHRDGVRGRHPVLGVVRENVLLGRPDLAEGVRMRTRLSRGARRSRRPTSSLAPRTAPTPASARRGSASPADSASVSRWRGRSRPSRPCSFSTTRCRRSTSTPRPASTRASVSTSSADSGSSSTSTAGWPRRRAPARAAGAARRIGSGPPRR